jgi:uncharacterized membrane protein
MFKLEETKTGTKVCFCILAGVMLALVMVMVMSVVGRPGAGAAPESAYTQTDTTQSNDQSTAPSADTGALQSNITNPAGSTQQANQTGTSVKTGSIQKPAGMLQVKVYVFGQTKAIATGTGILINKNTLVVDQRLLTVTSTSGKSWNSYLKQEYGTYSYHSLRYRVVVDGMEVQSSVMLTGSDYCGFALLRLATSITDVAPVELGSFVNNADQLSYVLGYPYKIISAAGQSIKTYQPTDCKTYPVYAKPGLFVGDAKCYSLSSGNKDKLKDGLSGFLCGVDGDVLGITGYLKVKASDLSTPTSAGSGVSRDYAVSSAYLCQSLTSAGITYNGIVGGTTASEGTTADSTGGDMSLPLILGFMIILILVILAIVLILLVRSIRRGQRNDESESVRIPEVDRHSRQEAAAHAQPLPRHQLNHEVLTAPLKVQPQRGSAPSTATAARPILDDDLPWARPQGTPATTGLVEADIDQTRPFTKVAAADAPAEASAKAPVAVQPKPAPVSVPEPASLPVTAAAAKPEPDYRPVADLRSDLPTPSAHVAPATQPVVPTASARPVTTNAELKPLHISDIHLSSLNHFPSVGSGLRSVTHGGSLLHGGKSRISVKPPVLAADAQEPRYH